MNIRETVMSTEEPKSLYPSDSLFNESKPDPYDGYYPDNTGFKSDYTKYSKKNSKEITISMIIENEDIGPVADELDARYDWNRADAKATEIAYDRIEKLLGKDYESKNTLSFSVTQGWGEYEVEITLTPNPKYGN